MLGRAKWAAAVKRYIYTRDELSNQGAEWRYNTNREGANNRQKTFVKSRSRLTSSHDTMI
jgi:hypothetical protein